MVDAIKAANSSTKDERRVLVPADLTFTMMPVVVSNIKNVTIQIDGVLQASKNYKQWPTTQGEVAEVHHFMEFEDVEDLVVEGKGTVDGQGYMWWVRAYMDKNKHGVPSLLHVTRGQRVEIYGLKFHNSPSIHLNMKDVDTLHIHDLEVYVNYKG